MRSKSNFQSWNPSITDIDPSSKTSMHLAVGGAVAKAASVKLAAMLFVIVASTTAALCILRLPGEAKEASIVGRASQNIVSLESRAERLGHGLALAKETAREAIERRKAEKNGDSGAVFWPGCVFFPCHRNQNNSETKALISDIKIQETE